MRYYFAANTTSGTFNINESGNTALSSTGINNGTLNVTVAGNLSTTGTVACLAGHSISLTTSTSNGTITIGSINFPAVTLTADGTGLISQTASTTLTASSGLILHLSGGTANLTTGTSNNVADLTGTGSGTIDLDNGGHAIKLQQFAASDNVSVTNAGAITTLTGGPGTSVDALTLSGTTIALSEAITAGGAVALTASTASGNVITQTSGAALSATSGLTVNLSGGTAVLTTSTSNDVSALTGTGSGSINLNNGGNPIQLNTFGTSENVTITNAAAVTTGTSGTNIGTLTVTGTSVALSEAITASGSASFTTTSGDISLTSALTCPPAAALHLALPAISSWERVYLVARNFLDCADLSLAAALFPAQLYLSLLPPVISVPQELQFLHLRIPCLFWQTLEQPTTEIIY